MLCEQYREGVMALLDGELHEPERQSIEHHLKCCPQCRHEYHQFEQLSQLALQLHFPPPTDVNWQLYWRGVCRKMSARASWPAWVGGAAVLMFSGTLMSFGFGHSALAVGLGAAAMAMGLGVLWLSYFCNCKK